MPAFNAAAADGDGGSWGLSSSSSSSGGLDLGLDESQLLYSRHRVYPEFSHKSNMGRLLFQGSPLGSQTTDDDVLVMDGVLVTNDSGSRPRRRPSFPDLGLVNADSPLSCGSGRYSSCRQVIRFTLLGLLFYWGALPTCYLLLFGNARDVISLRL
jgi:hypothetical protein